MVGMAGEEMTCTALHTKVVVVGSNKEILAGGLEGGMFKRDSLEIDVCSCYNL